MRDSKTEQLGRSSMQKGKSPLTNCEYPANNRLYTKDQMTLEL